MRFSTVSTWKRKEWSHEYRNTNHVHLWDRSRVEFSRKVMQSSPRSPESRAPAIEASESSLIAEERLDELRNVLKFHNSKKQVNIYDIFQH